MSDSGDDSKPIMPGVSTHRAAAAPLKKPAAAKPKTKGKAAAADATDQNLALAKPKKKPAAADAADQNLALALPEARCMRIFRSSSPIEEGCSYIVLCIHCVICTPASIVVSICLDTPGRWPHSCCSHVCHDWEAEVHVEGREKHF